MGKVKFEFWPAEIGRHRRSADFQSAVSRVFNPLAARLATRRRLQIGDSADYKSALRNRDARHLVIMQKERSGFRQKAESFNFKKVCGALPRRRYDGGRLSEISSCQDYSCIGSLTVAQ